MITAAQLGLSGSIGTRPVGSGDLYAWHRRIGLAARRGRREIVACLMAGLLLDALVVAGTVAIGALTRRPLHLPYVGAGVATGGAACLAMLFVAAVTKPEGRAETASRLIDQGFRQAGHGSANPAAGAAAAVLCVIALYGSFAWVEGFRRALARWKVSAAGTDEMARILATVCASPTGVSVAILRKHGQPIDALRLPVAALLLDGWVVLRDGGQVVQQRSPADRRRRSAHPLAELFAP